MNYFFDFSYRVKTTTYYYCIEQLGGDGSFLLSVAGGQLSLAELQSFRCNSDKPFDEPQSSC